ncbi:MAG: phytoene desaturase family protein [Alphaproteobacteria bacterium]
MASVRYDAIVVGGGHNGLSAAGYLAKAGLRTLVLERRAIVGGAAVTEEFHPGFRISTLSYVSALLHPKVIEDFELERLGYEVMPLEGSLMLCGDGRELLLTDDPAQQQREIGRYSNSDYAASQRFHALINEAATAARGQWLREPPPLDGFRLSDSANVVQLGRDLKRTGPEARRLLAHAMAGSARQIIERYFSCDIVRLYQASHIVIGSFAHLEAPGSAISFIRHGVQAVDGKKRPWGIVKGGMGAITGAMAEFAREKGCEIRTGAPVERILVEGGAAVGVRLADGTELRARVVVSNADPRRTFLGLVGEANLPEDFAADMRGYRMGTASFKLNLALSGLPRIGADDGREPGARHRTIINLVDSWPAIDRSYREASAGRVADPATVQIVFPSVFDAGLVPDGRHVASLACKYFPYDLADGKNWDDLRAPTADRILAWVERFIPGLGEKILARQAITPLDMEREYGLTRGDIHHGRIDPDQIWNLRPHADAAQYRTPVAHLYLCGSGTHPGGGVTGVPGHNAARRVLKDLRHRG